MLQSIPQAQFLGWLALRLGVEKPFVGYHASVALLAAVPALKDTHRNELRDAIDLAKTEFKRTHTGAPLDTTDRYQVLEEAAKELAG